MSLPLDSRQMRELVRVAHDVHGGDSVAVELEMVGLQRAIADEDDIAQRAVDEARQDLVALRELVADADEEAGDLLGSIDRVQGCGRLAAAVGIERRLRAEQGGKGGNVAA